MSKVIFEIDFYNFFCTTDIQLLLQILISLFFIYFKLVIPKIILPLLTNIILL